MVIAWLVLFSCVFILADSLNIQENYADQRTAISQTIQTSTPTFGSAGTLQTPPLDAATQDKANYSSNPNLFPEYHPTAEQIIASSTGSEVKFGSMTVYDKDGKQIVLPYTDAQSLPTYYTPGAFQYGSSSYVPNYEDSVYLSRTSGLAYMAPVRNSTSMSGGFCSYYKNSPQQLEEACQKQDRDTCGSTSCCVLLGGSKCVYGNETGPVMKTNYSDMYVKNRDYYYYQGKCYGNCP
jgi:hypothetical protein